MKSKIRLLVGLMFVSLAVQAQDAPPPAPVVGGDAAPAAAANAKAKPAASGKSGKAGTVNISFDDELVQGGVPKPEVDYIGSRRQFNFKKMIKLREHFIPEVQKGKSEYGIAD